MSNRIDARFQSLREQGKKGFIAYITAGDPNLKATEELALALEEAGVDLLELGVPFSDPLADGIVNQLAAQRALEAGTTIRGVLECVAAIRKRSQIPIVLYAYLNPICMYGFREFHEAAEAAGVDGLLILDLTPEEAEGDFQYDGNVHPINLIAPTTPKSRMATIASKAGGFIYYVSREGVTGEQSTVAGSIQERVAEIREVTSLPVAIGFGISNPAQATEVAAMGDAVVVGSAIVKQIANLGTDPDLAKKVADFVRPLVQAIK